MKMRTVKRQTAVLLLIVTALLPLCGCSSILDGEMMSISPHVEPSPTATDGVMRAETYEEIKECMHSFILARDDREIFRVYSYDGDVQNDVNRACSEIPKNDPIGAYAVSEMVGTVKQIVSYYEVEVFIAYKDVTKEQLESIINVSSAQELDMMLAYTLGEYTPSMTALAYGIELTESDALESVRQLYYENPGNIVMLPVTTVDFYPKLGSDRIIEYTFGYLYEASTLEAMEEALKDSVREIAEYVNVSESDNMQMLLMLARRLMESTEYDAETAAGDYSNQNTFATAYSALINGKAVSEGYAMAYKALCDELEIDCTVVIGEYAGALHAWNIVKLEDDYYHVDVSNCDLIGLDAAFLKNDAEMKTDYMWDTDAYPICDGPLSYISVATEPTSDDVPASEASTSEPSPDETVTDNEPTETDPEDEPAE